MFLLDDFKVHTDTLNFYISHIYPIAPNMKTYHILLGSPTGPCTYQHVKMDAKEILQKRNKIDLPLCSASALRVSRILEDIFIYTIGVRTAFLQ